MEILVYASFNTREHAQAVADALVTGQAPPWVVEVGLHEGRLQLAHISRQGTTARMSGLLGGLTCSAAAAASVALTSTAAVTGLPWLAVIGFAAIYGGALGGLGGALVGSAVPKAVVEQLARAVGRGAHVVTVGVANRDGADILRRWLLDVNARYVGEA